MRHVLQRHAAGSAALALAGCVEQPATPRPAAPATTTVASGADTRLTPGRTLWPAADLL